jgi:hypothetical protein
MEYKIELTDNELGEIIAKLANELETYDDQASGGLKDGFMKMYNLAIDNNVKIYETTLIKKWYNELK